jgi:hypothetical protein
VNFVVRWLPYHCQCNLIVFVWVQVKHEVTDSYPTLRLVDVEILMNSITLWQSCVKHAENIDDGDFRSEQLHDMIVDPVVVNLQDRSSSADNSDTCDDEEFSDCDFSHE